MPVAAATGPPSGRPVAPGGSRWLRLVVVLILCLAAALTGLFFRLPAHLMLERGAPAGTLGPAVSSRQGYLQPLRFAESRVSAVDVALAGLGGEGQGVVVRLLDADGDEVGRAAGSPPSSEAGVVRVQPDSPLRTTASGEVFVEVVASADGGVAPVGTAVGAQGPAYSVPAPAEAGLSPQTLLTQGTELPLSMSVRAWGLGPRALRAEAILRAGGAGALLLLAASVLFWPWLRPRLAGPCGRLHAGWGRLEERFARSRLSAPSRALSEEHLIRFDLRTQLVCVVTIGLFAILVAAGVHYSSIEEWNVFVPPGPGDPAAHALVAGHVKTIRSDEYIAGTPELLNTYASPRRLSAQRLALDAVSPWQWGFHVLGLERGFAFFWNFWYLGTFLSFFLLMLLLTRNDFWVSLVSALVAFFSAYNRWWDATTTMTTFAVALTAIVYFLQARRRVNLAGGFVLFLVFGAGFVLALYPAWQVPLSYLGLFVLVGFLAGGRFRERLREHGKLRAALAAAGLAGVLGAAYAGYRANAQTLRDMTATIYPGHRVSTGGDIGAYYLFSGYLDPLFTSGRYFYSNNCESSAYIFLWPFVLGALVVERLSGAVRKVPPLLIALSAYLVLLTGFALVGYGGLVARVTLLSYVTGKRTFLALGLSGIMLVGVYLGQRPAKRAPAWAGVLIAAVAFAGLVLFAWAFRQRYPADTWSLDWSVALPACAGVAVAVAAAVLRARALCLGMMLALVLVPSINVIPISAGLAPVYDKALVREVRETIRRDPDGRWLVYGDLATPNLVRAAGADVFNGVRFPPERSTMLALDRSGRFAAVWNRYAHIRALPGAPGAAPSFSLEQLDYYTLTVDPADPALAAAGIRYFVAPHADATSFPADDFRLLTPQPLNGFDIYERRDAAGG